MPRNVFSASVLPAGIVSGHRETVPGPGVRRSARADDPVVDEPGDRLIEAVRSSVPPRATVTGEFGLNVFGAPARNVPALTFVAPL